MLTTYLSNPWIADTVAAIITLAVAVLWLRIIDAFAHRGVLEPRLSRKIIHIGTGPLFVACWPLFSSEPAARWFAAAVPLVISLQFVAVGMGWMRDDAAVQAMTRTGDRREILRGPLYYGIAFVLVTLGWWRHSPVGILALMALCGGDGLADIVGRRFGRVKLPGFREKSWAGSAAMFVGSFVFGAAFVAWFNSFGAFTPALSVASLLSGSFGAALIVTLIEAVSPRDVDNLLIVAVILALGAAGLIFA